MTRKTKKIIQTWFWRCAVSLIVLLLVAINSNQQSIMIMETDALNQMNCIRQDIEDLRTEVRMSEFPDLWEDEQFWDTMDIEEDADPVSVHSLSPDERDLIERVVAAESRGEDMQGQMAVAQTILDRSELWNMTVTEVVTAPEQYADPYQGEISDSIHLAVANVFDGGVRVFEEPVTHFYSGSEPDWADEKIDRGGIGCHEFLY